MTTPLKGKDLYKVIFHDYSKIIFYDYIKIILSFKQREYNNIVEYY